MYTAGLFISALFASMATASPIMKRGGDSYSSGSSSGSSDDTFNIEVTNNCGSSKDFGLFQITSNFQSEQRSKTVTIGSNETQTLTAQYKDLGLRLSGHAEWGTAGQWKAQALVEFGYSEYGGQDGTAYNLSLMDGCEEDVGVSVSPISNDKGSSECPTKSAWPNTSDLSQAWTNPDQTKDGSPADTVCYKGKTDFKAVFCPSD